jgi:hypothetical protein
MGNRKRASREGGASTFSQEEGAVSTAGKSMRITIFGEGEGELSIAPNVFISWSGDRSRLVAEFLRGWIYTVVQAARPWMSDSEIEKGSRSLEEITRALAGCKVGIVCLTPENTERPWILYEAGCLSKSIDDRTRLCTYLIGDMQPSDIRPPLGMFQVNRERCGENSSKMSHFPARSHRSSKS